MLTNIHNSCGDVQLSRMDSVIKVPRSCCLKRDTEIAYQEKRKTDIQLTHQNYMITESENANLNLKVNDLDTRLNDQNYQYACLKYELERINRQKLALIDQSKALPTAPIQNQFKATDSSNIKIGPGIKWFRKSSCHAADVHKLPEIFCVCGRQLKSDKGLKEHLRYHNNNAKFVCKICELKTCGFNNLKSHMKTIHGINNLSLLKGCRTCAEVFGTLKQLHEHRRREHGRKRRGENLVQNKP